jgi:hypothetical protein
MVTSLFASWCPAPCSESHTRTETYGGGALEGWDDARGMSEVLLSELNRNRYSPRESLIVAVFTARKKKLTKGMTACGVE